MQPKAIFFDIDGTLLGSDRKIPDSALSALQEARNRGVLLFVATGRIPAMLPIVRDQFAFDGYLTMNGQYCFDRAGRVLHRMAHDRDDLRKLVALCEEEPIPCLIAEADACFMLCDTPLARRHFLWESLPVPQVYDPKRIDTHDVYQIITYDPPRTDPRLKPLRHIHITSAGDYCHDVIPAAGGKAVGIRQVAAQYGITPTETAAIGDGLNDVEMLQGAGVGVAMGNARAEAKAAADFVTTHVDENGVANALRMLGVC